MAVARHHQRHQPVRRCVICGNELHPLLDASFITHPTCPMFTEPDDADPFAAMLKGKLTEMILWKERTNPRALQTEVGPSEIGDPCDRRLGYKLAGIPPRNVDYDPWPSVMGTAMHTWLDDAVSAWEAENGDQAEWVTETPVAVGEFVKGRSDLYNRPLGCVIDHKSAGPDVMKKIKKEGPPPGYVVQIQCYGYGYEQLGWPVKKVALVFYPRAGWLRDMYVWTADYDRSIAEAALNRLYGIAHRVVSMDILKQSHRWEDVPATPSNSCGFCPWYDPGRDVDRVADDTGCAGR